MHQIIPRRRIAAAAVLALALAACTDRLLTNPESATPEPGAPGLQRAITCTADVREGALRCTTPAPSTGGANGAIIGRQNHYVRLASGNNSYDGSTFEIDVTLQNLLGVTAGLAPQTMGTPEGLTADSIRVFFSNGPTVTEGSGTVEVLADSARFFTAAEQPYYGYAGLLAPGATTAARRWRFSVPPTVDRFSFVVYVQARLSPALVITEIMANPSTVDDSVGEYIEIHNAGLDSVDLTGWRIASRSGSSTEQVTISGALGIRGGGYAVIAARANPARNGGIAAAYEWGGTAIQLSNSTSATAPDYVALRYPAAQGTRAALDSVVWAPTGTTTAPPNGRARELIDPLSNNVEMSSGAWNTAYSSFGSGDGEGGFDRGTPGQANAPFVPVGPPARLSINPGFAVIDTVRQFRRFSAFIEDSLGQPTTSTVTWATLDSTIATIDGTGLVTQVDTGQVLIVASIPEGLADTTLYSVFSYSPAPLYRDHVEFGQPSAGGAPGDTTDIIISRPEYVLSYNAARGGPNWVSWNLNRTHFGRVPRAPTFYPDTALRGVYLVTTNDYTNSGQTRGHMTQSEQRTQTRAANDATFFMTNILPQVEDLNTGPWQLFEEYTNDITRFHQREVYNVAGALYPASPLTLKGEGKVDIPSSTWKVIVVLPYGQGLADVQSAADIQVIAVDMPNTPGIRGTAWQTYVTTVDAIEAATGYDLLADLPDAVESAVEGS